MNAEETIEKCSKSTLSEATDEYLINRGIDKKKHYGKYLVIGKRVWQEIFRTTLWVVKTQWLPLKKGDPYPYIDMPRGLERLFTVNTVDNCGKTVSLYYNNQLNVVPRPKTQNCGCTGCHCAGLCEDVNSFQVTTKLLFTINGIEYFEKTWLKYCPNGDIWEYSQVPTKKYLDRIGDGGDYNEDYNNDYAKSAAALSNFEIVTQTFQKKLCTLEAKACGCPEESDHNHQMVLDTCGCHLSLFHRHQDRYCDPFLADPAPNVYGEVKISECGTRIYFKPPQHHFDGCGAGPRLPTHLEVSFQTDGINIGSDILVPDYALFALWTGVDWRSKLFNSRYPWNEKKGMEYAFNDACNDIILYLNSFNLQTLSSIQDAPQRW